MDTHPPLYWPIALVALLAVSGCSRTHYREAADDQVYDILTEKTDTAGQDVPRLDITPDPSSRLFDPTDPDCPPLPPDDPTAQQYMDCVYGMRGSNRWSQLGEVDYYENPAWAELLDGADRSSDGSEPVISDLTLVDAVELSLVHSRDYQTQLENLYLAALNLTYERYRFDLRPTGILGEPSTELFHEHQPDDSTGLALGPTTLGMSRLLPTGAQFAAELANNTLWLFSGPSGSGTATTVAYSLVQPLLGGAGREVVLEDLTQAERNVVYAVRDFARFRKQFFVNTITGGQVAGLQRFLRGFEFLADAGETPSVGFFPLLLRVQQLRNVATIVRTLEFLVEEMRAHGASPLDIARLESSLAYYRSSLSGSMRRFEDRMDQYKVQLGLPPDMEMSLDDSLLEPFQFVDPALVDVEDRLRMFGRDLRQLQIPGEPGQFLALLVTLGQLSGLSAEALTLVASDLRQLDAILPDRLARFDDEGKRQLSELIDQERIGFAEVRASFETTVGRLKSAQDQLAGQEVAADAQQDAADAVERLRSDLLAAIRRASVTQIIVRAELIPIEPVELAMNDAVQIALTARLDMMNRRGSVMDARRRLEVVADALEGTLDLVAEGQINTPALETNGKPFGLRARDSQFRVGLRFTTPLDRRAERNDFRASQIDYQRARRGYVAAEDMLRIEVRQNVRTLEELSHAFVQARRRVQFSARELDLAETQAGISQRGLSLTTALRGLNRAQDQLIEDWLDYETTRLNLFRDIGTMEIDTNGFWDDPFYRKMIEQDD